MLSRLDIDILEILQQDARTPIHTIAAQCGVSQTEAAEAIARLENSGVILRYPAMINWDKVDRDSVEALIEVRVSPQKSSGFDAIAEEIYRFDEVKSCYLMSGGYDLAVFIEGRTLREVARFVSERLATLSDVLSTATHFILKKYKIEGTITDTEDENRIRISVHA